MCLKPVTSFIATIIFATIPALLFANPVNKQPANKKPLSFIENKGQITDQYSKPRTDIDFKLSSNGTALFVGAGELHYQWYKTDKPAKPEKPADMRDIAKRNADTAHTPIDIYRMDVALVGANMQAEPVKEEMQNYHENYYLPQCPNGVTANTYTRVTYKNIYPGIDWVLYSKDGKVKYDFVVHAGADAGKIKLRYTGATNLQLKEGALLAETPFGTVEEAAPYVYEAASGSVVSSQYIVTGNTVQIKLDAHEGDIVIDPELRWGTYYGDFTNGAGAGVDAFQSVAADTSGKVAAVGTTTSYNNVVTTGTQQTTLIGTYDPLVVLFDTEGQPIWGTYYGGTGNDYLYAITTDISGQIFVAGTATSSGLGTSGTQQPLYSGGTVANPLMEDGIVVKFNPTNGLRTWATYLGANAKYDYIADIACDAAGDVYATGFTESTTGIATTGAFLTTHPGTNDGGFIIRYSGSTGTRTWGTYFPGNIGDITIDKFDRIYLIGATTYTTGVATTGAFQTTSPAIPGGFAGFFTRFTTSGSRVWGSYTLDVDYSYYLRLTCDDMGYLYVSGYTTLTTGIATPGTHKTTLTPPPSPSTSGGDMYLWKFDPSGNRIWGTYYGGEYWEIAAALTTDAAGNIYAWGWTQSSMGITTPDGVKTSLTNPYDQPDFLAEFSPRGQLKYGTYIGENEYGAWGGWGGGWGGSGGWGGWGGGNSGISYGKGYVYVGGATETDAGFTTPGSFKPTKIYMEIDAFLMQFVADTSVYIIPPIDTGLCKGQTLALNYGVTHSFRSGNVFTAQLSAAGGSFASPTNIGTATATDAGVINCTIPTTVATGSGYRIRIVATTPIDTSLDNGKDLKIGPSLPTGVSATSNSPVCSPGNNLTLVGNSGTTGVSYYWHGPDNYYAAAQSASYSNPPLTASGDYILSVSNSGCIKKDTVTVLIKLTPDQPTAGSNSPICEGAALNLTSNSATPGVTYEWTGPGGYTSTTQNPTIDPTVAANAGNYDVVAKLNGCSSVAGSTAVSITTVSYLGAYASPNDTVCEGTLMTFVVVPVNGGTSPQMQWYKNNAILPGETNNTYVTSTYADKDTFYCRMKAIGVCATPITLFSNKIGMVVMPINNIVKASISSAPSPAQPGQPVTFTANVTYGGYLPTYKWKRNGVDVGGNSPNWSTNNLHPYDKIYCEVTSSDACVTIKTVNSDTIEVNFPTSAGSVNKKNVQIYPNPVSDILYLQNAAINTTVKILDVVGREVYNVKTTATLTEINVSQLVAGNYLLQLINADGTRQVQKFVKD